MRWIALGALLGVFTLFALCGLSLLVYWAWRNAEPYREILEWAWPIAAWAAIGGGLGGGYARQRASK